MKSLYESILSKTGTGMNEASVISAHVMPVLKKRTCRFLKWERACKSGRTVGVPITHYVNVSGEYTNKKIQAGLYKDFKRNIKNIQSDLEKDPFFEKVDFQNYDDKYAFYVNLKPKGGLKENDYSSFYISFNVEDVQYPTGPNQVVIDKIKEIVFTNGPKNLYNNQLKISDIVRV